MWHSMYLPMLINCLFDTHFRIQTYLSSDIPPLLWISVTITPGFTALTRTPSFATSSAEVLTKWSTAALLLRASLKAFVDRTFIIRVFEVFSKLYKLYMILCKKVFLGRWHAWILGFFRKQTLRRSTALSNWRHLIL